MAQTEVNVGAYGTWLVEVQLISQNPGAWTSYLRVILYMRNNGTYRSYNHAAMSISGSGTWSDSSVAFSVNAKATVVVVDQYFTVSHNPDGTKSISFTGTLGPTGTTNFGSGGSTSVGFDLPSLATVPAAPTSNTPYNIKHTEMTFGIGDNGTGGAAIDQREYRYSIKPLFEGAVSISLPPNGIVVRDGLLPGTKYYFMGRVHNAVGWSSWSIVREATTLAGVYILVDDVRWLGVIYGKKDDVWYPGVPYGKMSDVWTPAAS